jgi:hypothetical protein
MEGHNEASSHAQAPNPDPSTPAHTVAVSILGNGVDDLQINESDMSSPNNHRGEGDAEQGGAALRVVVPPPASVAQGNQYPNQTVSTCLVSAYSADLINCLCWFGGDCLVVLEHMQPGTCMQVRIDMAYYCFVEWRERISSQQLHESRPA